MIAAHPEVAFVLKKDLVDGDFDAAQIRAAVDYITAAIEIVDSRVRDWKISLYDTIADNASSGGFVLGSTPTRLQDVDLRLTGCVFSSNSRIVGTGAGGAVLGSPITSLVWLANTVGALGTTLEAGHVILPGSVTSMVPVAVSAYTYSYAVMGEFLAWTVGWALLLEYAVGASAVSVGWSNYFTDTVMARSWGIELPTYLKAGPLVLGGQPESATVWAGSATPGGLLRCGSGRPGQRFVLGVPQARGHQAGVARGAGIRQEVGHGNIL